MSNRCDYCQLRTNTNSIVLNNGELWVEFCAVCGQNNILTNQGGENWLVAELFASAAQPGYVRNPEDVLKADRIALEQRYWASETYDLEYYEYIAAEERWDWDRIAQNDHWDNYVDRCLHSNGKHKIPNYLPVYN